MRTKTRTVGTLAFTELKLAHFPPRSALEATHGTLHLSSADDSRNVGDRCSASDGHRVSCLVAEPTVSVIEVALYQIAPSCSSPGVRTPNAKDFPPPFLTAAGSGIGVCKDVEPTLSSEWPAGHGH